MDHARALNVLIGVRARARWRFRWRSWLRERLNRCRVAVVFERWVYSLVCEPAYRPIPWLVSQRTPCPLLCGFSRSPLFPSSCRRFLPASLHWRTSIVYMCVRMCLRYVCVHRFASHAIIVTGETPLTRASPQDRPRYRVDYWRSPQFSEHRDRRRIDRWLARSWPTRWDSAKRFNVDMTVITVHRKLNHSRRKSRNGIKRK